MFIVFNQIILSSFLCSLQSLSCRRSVYSDDVLEFMYLRPHSETAAALELILILFLIRDINYISINPTRKKKERNLEAVVLAV